MKLRTQKDKAALKEQRIMRQQNGRQKLLDKLQKTGGLWRSKAEVEQLLRKMSTSKQEQSLKLQISARRRLLQSKCDQKLFCFTQKKVKFNVETLKQNLLQIIEISNSNIQECDKNSLDLTQVRLTPALLVGKAISHFYSEEGEEKWWDGQILRQKKNSLDFYIKYDNDENEWELSLDQIIHDIEVGDLVCLSSSDSGKWEEYSFLFVFSACFAFTDSEMMQLAFFIYCCRRFVY